jgi:hypothetical protein
MTRDLMFQDQIREVVRDAYGAIPTGAGLGSPGDAGSGTVAARGAVRTARRGVETDVRR